MTITTVSSRELNQDIGSAKRAALQGPVYITDRGKPAHVLLSMAEYERLTGQNRTLGEVLAMPSVTPTDFEPPRIDINLQIPDFD